MVFSKKSRPLIFPHMCNIVRDQIRKNFTPQSLFKCPRIFKFHPIPSFASFILGLQQSTVEPRLLGGPL